MGACPNEGGTNEPKPVMPNPAPLLIIFSCISLCNLASWDWVLRVTDCWSISAKRACLLCSMPSLVVLNLCVS